MGGKTSNESKAKYNAKAYDRINIAVPKGRKAEIEAVAKSHGQSINGYINGLIDLAIEQEQARAREGTGAETEGGVVLVSSPPAPDDTLCSRSTSQAAPDSQSGPATPRKQESLAEVAKRLSAMSPEERDIAMMGTPERRTAVREWAESMEKKAKQKKRI